MNIWNSAEILGRHFGVYKGTIKESAIAPGLRKFTFWLSLLVVLLSLSAGIFWLQANRTTDLDQARAATENASNQGTVSLAQAIQALTLRH